MNSFVRSQLLEVKETTLKDLWDEKQAAALAGDQLALPTQHPAKPEETTVDGEHRKVGH